jgi:hypothetical protein
MLYRSLAAVLPSSILLVRKRRLANHGCVPRANRYFVPGKFDHLTHRCHVADCPESLRVLGGVSLEPFRTPYEALIQTRLAKDLMAREPQWTESIAVGSRAFVEAIAKSVTYRQRLTYSTVGESAWALREDPRLPVQNCSLEAEMPG